MGNKAVKYTSTDKFCESCHVHPHSTTSWEMSVHHDNRTGIHVHCVECHLPPHGKGYLIEKTKLGIKDVWSKLTKDTSEMNWEAKSTVELAQHFTFKEACINCHANLFPLTLNEKGENAHLYYSQNKEELHCINCHLDVGHFDPNAKHDHNADFGSTEEEIAEIYTEATTVTSHSDFTEYIPKSSISFNMKAIDGGTFKLGSPKGEAFRKNDEGPVKEVKISPFFMAEIEVSWDEYLAFYAQTAAEGRSTDTEGARKDGEIDGITGATPPYGQPDQNWGLGKRPAITMSFHSAETYCKWLTQITGKTYRLPTEAEWEYAARGGTEGPYFFEGNPKKYSADRFWNKIFGVDTTNINTYVIYTQNSNARTQEPSKTSVNPFGLKNMLGNVAEFCSDWYAPDAYGKLQNGVTDPKGPDSGEEHVVRGGSFKSKPGDLRCSSRDYTRTKAWLKTDPQMPKSIWWLSDCNSVGFRVVCEFDEKTGK
jgi:formylglycine-generating enzyme required for sulfatase activity/nitrate/TMAO reductase-like tetraheme cytochrome c subunit